MISTIPRGHAQAILRRCQHAKLALARSAHTTENRPPSNRGVQRSQVHSSSVRSASSGRSCAAFANTRRAVSQSHESVVRGWLGTNTLRLRTCPRGFRQNASQETLPKTEARSSAMSSKIVSIAKATADAKPSVEHAGLSASTCALAVSLNAKPLAISASPAAPRRRHRAWMMIIASYHFAKSSCWR